jgi:hypothetical protein
MALQLVPGGHETQAGGALQASTQRRISPAHQRLTKPLAGKLADQQFRLALTAPKAPGQINMDEYLMPHWILLERAAADPTNTRISKIHNTKRAHTEEIQLRRQGSRVSTHTSSKTSTFACDRAATSDASFPFF